MMGEMSTLAPLCWWGQVEQVPGWERFFLASCSPMTPSS
jgi:hypothetical protein